MKIYTKTGDKGKTSLFDGTRVYKNDPRVEAYGTIDELNSVIGIIIAELQIIHSASSGQANYELRIKKELIAVQHALFELGANLANPQKIQDHKFEIYLQKKIEEMETYIDELTAQIPELTNFILPGGGTTGAFLQLARTVSRSAERTIVSLSQQEQVSKEILIYINRLSDLFHTMSRYTNMIEKKKEIIWQSEVR